MTPKIFESEYRFCLILWENEPISCSDIAKLCKAKLEWSRTTTYTVIKRLEERGVLKKDGSMVSSLVSKDEAQRAELDEVIEKRFEGSMPAFIAAFAKMQKLSDAEIAEIQSIIDNGGQKK